MKKIYMTDIHIVGMGNKSMKVQYECQTAFISRKVFNQLCRVGYIEGAVIERPNTSPMTKDCYPITRWIAALSAF